MNDLFEIGELGILRDIPAELSSKTKENIFLKAEISGQQKKMRLLWIFLGGIASFWIWDKYFRGRNTTDENSNS
jgi:hypothetical protein